MLLLKIQGRNLAVMWHIDFWRHKGTPTAVIRVRGDGDLYQKGSSGGCGRWQYFGLILKMLKIYLP